MKEIITTAEDTIARIVEREYGETDPETIKAIIDEIARENQVGSLISLVVGQILRLPGHPDDEKPATDVAPKKSGGKADAKDS